MEQSGPILTISWNHKEGIKRGGIRDPPPPLAIYTVPQMGQNGTIQENWGKGGPAAPGVQEVLKDKKAVVHSV